MADHTLKKLEYLIRPASKATAEQAYAIVRAGLLQAERDDAEGCYFAHLYDARNNTLVAIYSDLCAAQFSLSQTEFHLIQPGEQPGVDLSGYVTQDQLPTPVDLSGYVSNKQLERTAQAFRNELARLRAALPPAAPDTADSGIQQMLIVPTPAIESNPAPTPDNEAEPGGMDNQTGQALTGLDWLKQRVYDVLSTQIGSMPNRRGYGSRLPELLDAPMNPENLFEWRVAAIEALRRPINGLAELVLQRVGTTPHPESGQVVVEIYGYRRDDGTALAFGVAL